MLPAPGLPGPRPGQVQLKDPFPGDIHQNPQGKAGRESVLGLRTYRLGHISWDTNHSPLLPLVQVVLVPLGAILVLIDSAGVTYTVIYDLTLIMYMKSMCVCTYTKTHIVCIYVCI